MVRIYQKLSVLY